MEPGEITDLQTRATVAVAGNTYVLLGLPLSDWVAIFTIVYLACQVIVLAPKVYRTACNLINKIKGKKNGESTPGEAK